MIELRDSQICWSAVKHGTNRMCSKEGLDLQEVGSHQQERVDGEWLRNSRAIALC